MLKKDHSRLLKIVLFEPEIAQNVGTIVRLCACFGISLGVIGPCGFPFSSRALKRTMMDYGDLNNIESYNSFQKYFEEKKNQKQESRMILLTTKGNKCLWDFKFSTGDHLFFGNEGHGVPNTIATESDAKVFIPMPGEGRSLNLAVSASIALAEATRQLIN
jgi:tRNA (cytidine/uridine-2'-O-)-methyltransferase